MVLSLSLRVLLTTTLVRAFTVIVLLTAPLACFAETVLLDFSSPTCGPCQQMRPIVQQLANDGFRVQEIDVSREPQVAAQFGVTQVPTFIVLVDQRPVDRVVGATSYQDLRAMMLRATPVPSPRRRVTPFGQSPDMQTPDKQTRIPSTFASSAAKPQATGSTHNPFAAAPSRPAALAAGSSNLLNRSLNPSLNSSLNPLHRRLLEATVKLTIDDPEGKSVGTGTIVDARSGEALVLTCGHLFRTSEGKGTITVTTFQAGAAGATPGASYIGHLIEFDLERDLALVSLRPTAPVGSVTIAGVNARRVMESTPVTSVGCSHGEDPTAIDSRVSAVDRFEGTPNVEVAGAPVEGRSGGGLFNAAGQLVGVCYAAEPQADEGLYVSLPAIYRKLDSLNLSMIYRAGATGSLVAQAAAVAPVRTPPQTRLQTPPRALAAIPPFAVRGQEPEAAAAETLAMAPAERAALEEIRRRGADSEVICIIRSHDPAGKSEVITLNNVSPAFVRALSDPAARQPSATAAAGQLLR